MNKWSLSKKIWAIIGLLSIAFVGSTVFSLQNLSGLRDSLNDVTGNVVKRDQLTAEIKDNQRRLSNVSAESILFTDQKLLKANEAAFTEVVEKQNRDVEAYKALASEKGMAILNRYLDAYGKYLAGMKRTRELALQNKNQEATGIYIETRDQYLGEMRKHVEELNQLTSDQLAQKSQEANADASRAITLGVLVSTVAIMISVLIAFMVLRAVTRAIAAVVQNLSDSSIQVSGAASQIAGSSEELSQSATEQAASLEETAASVEEMNSMIAKNSDNANSAASTSNKSQEAVVQGQDVIKKMMDSMEKINASSEGMAEIVKVIEQIDKKTKVINEIVNKTELLSFNASVEAARAGEHGKGFAVVAEEVGNLARMSGTAAEEIASLLEESINKVNQMVQDTKTSVNSGTQVTRECGEVFQEIVENVSKVSGMATEIASASQEQARGCAEITKAMSQLDQMTQQNAATSEECASAAEELSAQAEALKSAVNQLVSTVNGGNGQEAAVQTLASAPAPVQKKPVARPAANVVHLKGPKTSSPASAAPVLKKASGDAPSYDSSGFEDV